MKSIVKNLLLLLGVALAATACTQANKNNGGEETPTRGIVGVSESKISVNNSARVKTVKFVAFDTWTITSDAEWCQVIKETASGEKGADTVRFIVTQNENAEVSRTATLSATVKGFPVQVLCTVTQSKDGGATGGREVNRWMADYMASSYLWNEDFGTVETGLDFDAKPQDFLTAALNEMRNNADDGGRYANNERFFYTYLREALKQPASAPSFAPYAAPLQGEDLGIKFVYPVMADDKGNYYFMVGAVYKDSPADRAGIKRGMYITKFNGQTINATNLAEYFAYLMAQAPVSKADLQISQYVLDKGNYVLTDQGLFPITVTSYDKNPIIYYQIAKLTGTAQTIGYVVLSDFDMTHDDDLINLFAEFKSYNVTDLILDLRYNGGGDVYASAVLGTLVVGNAYTGQVYSHMEFNELRKNAGEEDFFYIGKEPTVGPYPKIVEALSQSLNLQTVYVIGTGFTASASELVINGLRGLGVKVYTLGETTEGKNVGMEVINSAQAAYKDYNFGDYIYEFAPITFYNKNAQGFKDYGTGFVPDYFFDETTEILFDWQEGVTGKDWLFNSAVKHIQTGAWQPKPSASPTRASERLRVDTKHRVLDRAHSRGLYVYRDVNQTTK